MEAKKIKLSKIKPNPDNPRSISNKDLEKLKNSISEFSKMMHLRPLVIDGNNMVLGGNQRLRALKELGYEQIPEEWVKRAEDLTEEEKKRFIIADNISNGEWDYELLENWDKEKLEEWGLKVNWDIKYTQNIGTPIYEPKNEKPEISELYNSDRYRELVNEIEDSSVDEDIKEILKISASRHIVFNYENMAEFYAHSDKETQKLMEDSALVIIDFNRAIELGYVKLTDEIREQYETDYMYE